MDEINRLFDVLLWSISLHLLLIIIVLMLHIVLPGGFLFIFYRILNGTVRNPPFLEYLNMMAVLDPLEHL